MTKTRREFLRVIGVLAATTGLSATHAHAAAVAPVPPAARDGRRSPQASVLGQAAAAERSRAFKRLFRFAADS